MARITVEDCLRQVTNRFALVILAAYRAKQLMQGSDRLVPSDNKEAVTALREIAAGKVKFHNHEEGTLERLYIEKPQSPTIGMLE